MNELAKSPYKENDTLAVTCTIDRLYPQIQPANFTMTWGDTTSEAVSLKNNDPDLSYRYRVHINKTLTKEDNGMTVTCNVNPVRGTPVSEQRTLNVQCKYSVLTCVWNFFGSHRVHSHISLHKFRPLKTLNFGKRAIKVL